MTEPTDAELDELRQANSGRLNFVTFSEFRTIARAVLAKWGSQPSPASQGDALDAEQHEMDARHAAIYRWMLIHVADALSIFDNWLADGEADTDELHDALAARAARAPSYSVLEDAARWKMAVLVGNEVMMHPEKRTHPAAVKAYMDAVHSGLDLTGAIDAARKQGANHD